MPPLVTCPSTEMLSLLLLGQLSDDESTTVEAHLESCPQCVAALRQIEPHDPVVDALRSAKNSTISQPDPLVGELIGQLRQQPASRSPLARDRDETLGGSKREHSAVKDVNRPQAELETVIKQLEAQ